MVRLVHGSARKEAREADITAKRLAALGGDLPFRFVAMLWVHPTAYFAPQDRSTRTAAAGELIANLQNDRVELLPCGSQRPRLVRCRRCVAGAHGVEQRSRVCPSCARIPVYESYSLAVLAIRSPDLGEGDQSVLFREALERLRWNAVEFVPGLGAHRSRSLVVPARHCPDRAAAARVVGFLDVNDPGGNQTYARACAPRHRKPRGATRPRRPRMRSARRWAAKRSSPRACRHLDDRG